MVFSDRYTVHVSSGAQCSSDTSAFLQVLNIPLGPQHKEQAGLMKKVRQDAAQPDSGLCHHSVMTNGPVFKATSLVTYA